MPVKSKKTTKGRTKITTKAVKAPRKPERRRRKRDQRKVYRKVVDLQPVTIIPASRTLYRDEYPRQARALCELGATDYELAAFFEVATMTIYRWSSRYPEFFEATRRGKESADERVVRALYSRATGYTYESEKILNVDGVVKRVRTLEHVPPDVTACIFWLKNRRSAEWRDKQEHQHLHGHLNLPTGDMSIADAQDLFRRARNMTPQELQQQFQIIDGQVVNAETVAEAVAADDSHDEVS